jgi:prefoldin alpha subunit
LLKEQIDALQAYLQQLIQARDSVLRAMDSLKAVNNVEGSVLVYLDPHMNVAIKVNPVEKDKMLVHLGLNVYARTSLEEALKVLEDRRARLDKAVEETRRAIGNLASLHDQYQALLQRVLAQAQARGRG